MKKIFFFLAAMALAITANAKVTTISPDAENDALRLAVHYAEDGDIIEMTEGTYVQCNNSYVAFDGKSVTVKAAEGANVVLQLQVPITLANGGKATLQGIKIDASRLTELADWYEHVIYPTDATEGKELVMDGCELYGFNINKSAIFSSSSNTLALCDVKDCYFHDNMKSCFFFEGSSIAELSVVNSTFANIATDASGYYAGIIDVRNAAAKVTVDHCTFYNCLLMNTDYAAVTMKGPQAANVVISNNIFMLPEAIDGHRAIRESVEATNCMTFNYVKDNGGIHSSVTKTNCFLNVDPNFVDAANGNFALADGSPALTAGTDGKAIGDPRWNVVAEPEPTTETVYFINTKNWSAVTVHAWDGKAAGTAWPGLATVKETEKIAGYDVYSFTAKVGDYAKVIFNNNNGGSQTADLVWTAGKYYVMDMGWLTKEEAETKLAAPLPEVWTIVGAAGLMGKDWDLNAAENAMTKQGDGTYKLEKKGITLTAGTYEYKAAKDHDWAVSVPAGADNQKLTISTNGIYDVTFVLDVTAKKLTATATLKQAAVIIPTVVIAGDMNSWSTTKDKFTMSADSLTATLKTTLAVKNYGFKMVIGGNWQSDAKTITRAANSTKFTGANGGNSTLKADIAGDYLFTWEYATKTLTVTYPELPVEYTVTATVNPAETGTVEGAGKYEEGTEITLTATPAEGYEFVNWTKDEEVVSTENSYTFVVTADIALVANFELIPPIKYNVSVTAENGTVTGAGEYEEDATATLTATPAEGYEFVNWTVGEEVVSTENPYTFTVTADIVLVANFELIPVVEPEKPEPTYTDNILNPYAFGLESVLSEDKATLTFTYRLNNTKATAVDVVVYNGEEVVKVVTGTKEMGKNTVEIPTEGLPAFKNLTWSVKVKGSSVEAPTQEEKSYSFWGPRGLAIDTDPESENFGRILVTESYYGTKGMPDYVASGKGSGIYTFNPSFTTDSVVYTGGNDFSYVLGEKKGFQPWRVKISEDGRIFVSSLDLNGVVVWEVSKDLQTWTPVISGAHNADDYRIYDEEGNFVAGPNVSMDVIGSGEDLKLLLYSTNNKGIAYNQSGYRLDEYALGTATTWTGTPKNILEGGKYGLVHTDVDFVYDGEGGYWFGGSRGGNAGEPSLVHINAEGVEDFRDETTTYYGGAGVLVQNGMLIKGKARTSGTVGNFGIYTIGKDAEGKVTLTEKWAVVSNGLGRNHNAFAIDYAGNLYVIGNSSEKIIAYAMPYSGTVETPAASKYAFQLEGQLAETWDVTMTNLQVDDYGESIGLSADDKNTGLNVWLTIDTNGVIIPDYSSAAIVQGWSEIELPIVAGNLTKTYVDSLDTDVYSGLVIAEFEGGYLGLNLTMYYVPVPPVVVIVENATVDDQTENTGIMYMRGQWTDAESVVYPVTVEVPGFDATLAETVYNNVTVTVGGIEDEPWLGFGQGSATVTIANNLVTLKSVVSDWGGTVIDITISGNLSQGPGTDLDNIAVEAKAIKMIKNGQLIIIKNGVQYNVQGQVIK